MKIKALTKSIFHSVLIGWCLCFLLGDGRAEGRERTEPHVEAIRDDLRTTVNQLKSYSSRVTPARPPRFLAFWDFDGTLLKGDSSEGLKAGDKKVYEGFMEAGIKAGFSKVYSADDTGVARFWEDYVYMDKRIGHWLSYPYLPQLFRGARLLDLETLSHQLFDRSFRHYLFNSSMLLWEECQRLGVVSHVISAGADFIVQGASKALEIDRGRIHGIKLVAESGKVTEELIYPVTYADGKRIKLESIVAAEQSRPEAGPVYVIAAFGNSYSTDGPFLKHVQGLRLPAGKTTVVMINGGPAPEGYEGLFRCVQQERVPADSSRE